MESFHHVFGDGIRVLIQRQLGDSYKAIAERGGVGVVAEVSKYLLDIDDENPPIPPEKTDVFELMKMDDFVIMELADKYDAEYKAYTKALERWRDGAPKRQRARFMRVASGVAGRLRSEERRTARGTT